MTPARVAVNAITVLPAASSSFLLRTSSMSWWRHLYYYAALFALGNGPLFVFALWGAVCFWFLILFLGFSVILGSPALTGLVGIGYLDNDSLC